MCIRIYDGKVNVIKNKKNKTIIDVIQSLYHMNYLRSYISSPIRALSQPRTGRAKVRPWVRGWHYYHDMSSMTR
jgi:hypothetical protein